MSYKLQIGKLLTGAAALLLAGSIALPAQAYDHWNRHERIRAEIARLHQLCGHGHMPACVQFGVMIGRQHEWEAHWRRMHPEWWWWEGRIGN
jgi:hypothetical protein